VGSLTCGDGHWLPLSHVMYRGHTGQERGSSASDTRAGGGKSPREGHSLQRRPKDNGLEEGEIRG
jgi:hypothetical protein